jgi:hypothetical protein
MSARRHSPRSGSPVLADLPPGRGSAAQALRHRSWAPEQARDEVPPPPPESRRSSSFAAPLRESFFDLAQRYHALRDSAFRSKSRARTQTEPPPLPLVRERRLADLPPPPAEEESVTRMFADARVEEGPEEATLVQPLARRQSEPPPPPASERRAAYATTMRPPPPPDPLPRLLPSTMPPPPVALATLPPPPPAPPPNLWSPMLATAALSATIGAIVSVGLWAMRSGNQEPPLRPNIISTAPTAQGAVGPCPIPASLSSPTAAPGATTPRSTPSQVSLEALPVEISPPHAVAAPVLRAPAAAAAPVARVSTRAAATRAAAAPVAASRATSDEQAAERRAKRSHKSDDDDSDTPPAVAAPSPPPVPTAGPDRAAIARAVGRASAAATSCESGPQSGRAQITFAPSGNVQSVQLIQPFSDNAVNGCVLRALGRAHVPAFAGDPVVVRKALSW